MRTPALPTRRPLASQAEWFGQHLARQGQREKRERDEDDPERMKRRRVDDGGAPVAGPAQATLVLKTEASTKLPVLMRALDAAPPGAYLCAVPDGRSASGLTIVARDVAPTVPEQQALSGAIAAMIGSDLIDAPFGEASEAAASLKKSLGLDEIGRTVAQLKPALRLAQLLPILSGWDDLSDKLTCSRTDGAVRLRWVPEDVPTNPADVEAAKSELWSIADDACRAFSADRRVRPTDLFPKQATDWFLIHRGMPLTASVVRQLGRSLERAFGQYKAAPVVDGPAAAANVVDLMQTLNSRTFICAGRDAAGTVVLKTQLHRPSRREEEMAKQVIQRALHQLRPVRDEGTSFPRGPIRKDIAHACEQIRRSDGLTSRFLSEVIDRLRENIYVDLASIPPYYGIGDEQSEGKPRMPRMPIPRDAKYQRVLTQLEMFDGVEFDTPDRRGVRQLWGDELAAHRIEVDAGNHRLAVGGVPITHENTRDEKLGGNARAIYVMDIHGQAYAGFGNTYQHSTFMYQIADGGEIRVRADDEVNLSNRSGRAAPLVENTEQTRDSLMARGLTKVTVSTWNS
ncbi:MAG: hypothetical protein ABW032_01240 [Burkholderiaceae bacterium]